MKTIKQLLQNLSEKTHYASDFKLTLSPTGKLRKVHPGRIVFAGYDKDSESAQEKINKKFDAELEGKPIEPLKTTKKQQLNKESSHNAVGDPPPVLMLKRKNVRLFADGTKVALYYNEKLDKHFTVAVGPNIDSNYQAEEICSSFQELIESSVVVHKDFDITKLSQEDIEALSNLYNELSEQNQQVMFERLLESTDSFNKILQFARSAQ